MESDNHFCGSCFMLSFQGELESRHCSARSAYRPICISILGCLVVLPRDRPVFIWPSRPDEEVSVRCEVIYCAEGLCQQAAPCDGSLHMMRQRMRRLIES